MAYDKNGKWIPTKTSSEQNLLDQVANWMQTQNPGIEKPPTEKPDQALIDQVEKWKQTQATGIVKPPTQRSSEQDLLDQAAKWKQDQSPGIVKPPTQRSSEQDLLDKVEKWKQDQINPPEEKYVQRPVDIEFAFRNRNRSAAERRTILLRGYLKDRDAKEKTLLDNYSSSLLSRVKNASGVYNSQRRRDR